MKGSKRSPFPGIKHSHEDVTCRTGNTAPDSVTVGTAVTSLGLEVLNNCGVALELVQYCTLALLE